MSIRHTNLDDTVVSDNPPKNSHSTFYPDVERPPTLSVSRSGMFRGVWVQVESFSVIPWGMVKNALIITPEDAIAIGGALVRAGRLMLDSNLPSLDS